MTDYYVDFDKTPSTEDGTSWANAWISMTQITGLVGGDRVFFLASTTDTLSANLNINIGINDDEVVLFIACKAGTTNEPPAASDLIPGYRTGNSSAAYDYTGGGSDFPPIIDASGGAYDITLQAGFVDIYGLHFKHGDDFGNIGAQFDGAWTLEECKITVQGSGDIWRWSNSPRFKFINCEAEILDGWYNKGFMNTFALDYGMKISSQNVTNPVFAAAGTNAEIIHADGTDFSDRAHELITNTVSAGAHVILKGCKLNGSTVIVNGAGTDLYTVEQYGSPIGGIIGQTDPVTDYDLTGDAGSISQDTGNYRDNGTTDGVSNYSLSFTGNSGRVNSRGPYLEGPWIHFPVNKTDTEVEIYIANATGNLHDGEVVVEMIFPSNSGTETPEYLSTLVDLLGSTANYTTDSSSTWTDDGTTLTYKQKITMSSYTNGRTTAISPNYAGMARYRLLVGTTTALYLDPKPVVT